MENARETLNIQVVLLWNKETTKGREGGREGEREGAKEGGREQRREGASGDRIKAG